MDAKKFKQLKALYQIWTTEDLIAAVDLSQGDYEPEALSLMQAELASRKISEDTWKQVSARMGQKKKEKELAASEAATHSTALWDFHPYLFPIASNWEVGRYLRIIGEPREIATILSLFSSVVFAIYTFVVFVKRRKDTPNLLVWFSFFNVLRWVFSFLLVFSYWNVFVISGMGGKIGGALGCDMGVTLYALIFSLFYRRSKKAAKIFVN